MLRWRLRPLAAGAALLPLACLATHSATAQAVTHDLLVLTDNTTLKVKVKRIGTTEIEYLRADNLNGPIYSVERERVQVIVYANGTSETLTPAAAHVAAAVPRPAPRPAATPAPAAPDAAPARSRVAEAVRTPTDGEVKSFNDENLATISVYGTGSSTYGISIERIYRGGNRSAVAPSFISDFGYGGGVLENRTALCATSPLYASSGLIPFYRAGLGFGVFHASYDSRSYTSYALYLPLGLGLAIRSGERGYFTLGGDFNVYLTGGGGTQGLVRLGYTF